MANRYDRRRIPNKLNHCEYVIAFKYSTFLPRTLIPLAVRKPEPRKPDNQNRKLLHLREQLFRKASRPTRVFNLSRRSIAAPPRRVPASPVHRANSASFPSTVGENAICTARPNKFHQCCQMRSNSAAATLPPEIPAPQRLGRCALPLQFPESQESSIIFKISHAQSQNFVVSPHAQRHRR